MNKLFDIKNISIKEDTVKLHLNNKHETFLLISEGLCSINLDKATHTDIGKSIIYIPSHNNITTDIYLTSKSAEIWLLDFHKEIYPHFFFEIYNYFNYNKIVSFEAALCFENMINLCKMIHFETIKDSFDIEIIKPLIESYFSIYYGELKNQTAINYPQKSNYHINKLLDLIENNYRKNHPLEFYANNLVLTERQLNNLTSEYLNKTLSNLVISRKIIQAQKELLGTQKTISEIGFDLGYNEKSYFSKVFKKTTGKTPSEYQNSYQLNAK